MYYCNKFNYDLTAVRDFNLHNFFLHFRILWQVFEQVQWLVYTTGMARMGWSYNELALLQLQRQYERQEDKARLRVQQRLLSGLDSQRQRGFPKAEQTQFCPKTGYVSRKLSSSAWSGGFGAAVFASLLQRHHSSVSTTKYLIVFVRVLFNP